MANVKMNARRQGHREGLGAAECSSFKQGGWGRPPRRGDRGPEIQMRQAPLVPKGTVRR